MNQTNKKQNGSISDFLCSTAQAEKLKFLGNIAKQVNEDQRAILEKARKLDSTE